MTYTQRMHDALIRLGKQRKEEGKLPNQYDDLIGEIDRLNTLIDKWRPIETAPKDRYILVYMPVNINSIVSTTSNILYTTFIAKWDKWHNAFCVFGTYRERPDEYSLPETMKIYVPTHWMPLPEPPKDK